MAPETRWRPQPTMGSGNRPAARVWSRSPSPTLPAAEWRALLTARPNLLLVGSRSATKTTLTALEPHLVRPHWRCHAKNGILLPLQRNGTLILHEVAALASYQQALFFRWLEEVPERMQIVCVTDTPLFSLVEQGTFLADLYYRLNTIQVELPRP